MGKRLYILKLGGSVITDTSKPSTAKKKVIARLFGEIKNAKKKEDFDIIIGHGAGSFGHIIAKQYKLNEGISGNESLKGLVLAHKAMLDLNRIVVDTADEFDLLPHLFTPSNFAYSNGRRIVGGNLEGMKRAIASGFVPIVHGDAIFNLKQGVVIASTEEVFRFITTQIKPNKVIIGTDIKGVYDKDPSLHPNAKLIESIDSTNIQNIVKNTGGARKVDVTGGMKTKLSILYEMVKSTNSTGYIANAGKPGVIYNLLRGREVVCTKIMP